mmetsp:Transcript_27484/g.30614  ORF Transcript_27484/g.30614 Transcript_27484/m.30614 type:complete len:120 (+) Transcript_27484:8-367(+)
MAEPRKINHIEVRNRCGGEAMKWFADESKFKVFYTDASKSLQQQVVNAFGVLSASTKTDPELNAKKLIDPDPWAVYAPIHYSHRTVDCYSWVPCEFTIDTKSMRVCKISHIEGISTVQN